MNPTRSSPPTSCRPSAEYSTALVAVGARKHAPARSKTKGLRSALRVVVLRQAGRKCFSWIGAAIHSTENTTAAEAEAESVYTYPPLAIGGVVVVLLLLQPRRLSPPSLSLNIMVCACMAVTAAQ